MKNLLIKVNMRELFWTDGGKICSAVVVARTEESAWKKIEKFCVSKDRYDMSILGRTDATTGVILEDIIE